MKLIKLPTIEPKTGKIEPVYMNETYILGFMELKEEDSKEDYKFGGRSIIRLSGGTEVSPLTVDELETLFTNN